MNSCLLEKLEARALNVRRDVIRMIGMARTGRMASALSVVDILVWLYGSVLSVRPDEPLWEKRDRFVLGRGAASPVLYAVLADLGFFPRDDLWSYRRLGSTLQGFADYRRTPGIDVSCGASGMGPGIAMGLALALSTAKSDARVFCLTGGGELHAGAVWETLLGSAGRGLGNLTLIVDRNESGSVTDLEPLEEKFEAFGWAVVRVDGHDMKDLDRGFASLPVDRARILIAETVRGRGLPSLEAGENPETGAGWETDDEVVLNRQLTDELLTELGGVER